jgi:hypothetical protein
MLYNQLIEEIIKRVEIMDLCDKTRSDLTFSEMLGLWLEDFEHDVLLSKGGKQPLTEEFLANKAFDKKLDEQGH